MTRAARLTTEAHIIVSGYSGASHVERPQAAPDGVETRRVVHLSPAHHDGPEASLAMDALEGGGYRLTLVMETPAIAPTCARARRMLAEHLYEVADALHRSTGGRA